MKTIVIFVILLFSTLSCLSSQLPPLEKQSLSNSYDFYQISTVEALNIDELNERLEETYQQTDIRRLPTKLNIKPRPLLEFANGLWDWKKGSGIAFLLGAPLPGDFSKEIKSIIIQLQMIEKNQKKLLIQREKDLHITVDALFPNTDIVKDVKDRERNLNQARNIINKFGSISLEFYSKDLCITESGDIILLGYFSNKNLALLRSTLREQKLIPKGIDFVHMTLGRIFDDSISEVKLSEYVQLIQRIRQENRHFGNINFDQIIIWDQSRENSELRYGGSLGRIDL